MRLRVREPSGGTYLCDAAELDQELGTPGLGRLLTRVVGRRARRESCPVCGWTRAQFEATGLMGCGACYEVLDEG